MISRKIAGIPIRRTVKSAMIKAFDMVNLLLDLGKLSLSIYLYEAAQTIRRAVHLYHGVSHP
jgi:hypothetical protein